MCLFTRVYNPKRAPIARPAFFMYTKLSLDLAGKKSRGRDHHGHVVPPAATSLEDVVDHLLDLGRLPRGHPRGDAAALAAGYYRG